MFVTMTDVHSQKRTLNLAHISQISHSQKGGCVVYVGNLEPIILGPEEADKLQVYVEVENERHP